MRPSPPPPCLIGPRGVVASSVRMATTFRARRRGVLGQPLGPEEGLLIRPCRQVHTFGVGYDLDVVFCDRNLAVLHLETLPPERISKRVRRARCCFELRGGRAAACGVTVGTVLQLREGGDP